MVMALRKEKRVRRYRGSRTHGYGRIGQHRKGGQRGGKGKTGGHKHGWTYTVAKEPDRYGKHGFNRPLKLRQRLRTINVGEIVNRLETFTGGAPPPKSGPIPVNLTAHGYDKVLGGGAVSLPLAVTAPLFTRRAAEKIRAAGGTVEGKVLAAEEEAKPAKETKPPSRKGRKAKPARQRKTGKKETKTT